MAKIHCCSGFLIGKKKKIKESLKAVNGGQKNGDGTHQMEPGHPAAKFAELPNEKVFKEVPLDAVVPLGSHESSPPYDQRVVGDECLDEVEAVIGEGAYEGGDEHDEGISIKRDFSDLDLEARFEGKGRDSIGEMNYNGPENNKAEIDARTTDVMIQSGHLSDPGIGRSTAFWGSPILKRSCSNIERRTTEKPLLPPSNSVSYDDLQNIPEKQRKGVSLGIRSSPLSVMSCCSADRVMLKKRSSSQVLPSRSRKLWWKLFLWSHRNLHKSWISKSRRILSINENSNKNGGYTSDTLEPNNLSDRHITKGKAVPANISQNAIWPQNEWVAFSVDTSPIDRVNAWVNTLEDNLSNPIVDVDVDDDHYDELRRPDVSFMSSFEVGESSKKTYTRGSRHLEEEVLQANTIVQSLNSLSSTAHISGMGLKVIPVISAFSSLRSVNLSANIIVHITPGALPKSLHTLDLSRNKITTIEGLRELTRLRVLNLSYNKISRIGHGLSNCTIIKELYLAGNKISNVEGLHRLLKLSVLDLSFNKITTAKSLGQLVANYSSLLALNLLGNPIQSNIGDDQLRKAVCGLLPHLTYLNKQPIKPQSAREVATDSVAKAALGNSGWRSRRRGTRRANQGSISSVRGHSSNSRHRSKSGRRNSPPRKR